MPSNRPSTPEPPRSLSSLLAEVNRLVRKVTGHTSIEENTPLVSVAVLDSLSAISLVKALEDEFHFKFKDEDMSIDREILHPALRNFLTPAFQELLPRYTEDRHRG